MARTFDRELERLLRDAGWAFLRPAKGSHAIWHDLKTGRKVTLPQGTTSRHTADAILRAAGLPKAF
jgi:predicted RNA binding protein YcfA (HicA-like mRNA interferase family)